ncbi:phosphonate ABC transporter, permease protein PhnE, partial [Escherichia coli]
VLAQHRQGWNRSFIFVAATFAIIIFCWYYVDLFNAERLGEGIPSLISLVGEMFPPNFTQLRSWISPLADTLAMSVAG